jgi:protein SCO1
MGDKKTAPAGSLPFMWVGLGLTIALLMLSLALAFRLGPQRRQPLPIYGQVADFALTNQDGQPFTLSHLRERVWVADIIFTRCAGPCLKMSRQMKELQQALPPSSRARLVTLTTDPDYDTPPVLRAYGKRFDADPSRWSFLTGSKQAIANLAGGSLKLTAVEKPTAERADLNDLFIHSTILVLVDQRAQLRGVFETSGEGTDPQQVRTELLAAIKTLERDR